jgi:hypothetical protein
MNFMLFMERVFFGLLRGLEKIIIIRIENWIWEFYGMERRENQTPQGLKFLAIKVLILIIVFLLLTMIVCENLQEK